uniref:tRNase Z endonuclease domain-containing protein n=1 Tax=Hildenbrandia rivularis TaxID=135206 RepID=A0A1C9CFH8_9FLOR|nr:hypothetical protein Hrvl_098 [Hildenbrandia rivularis]AOM67158.1 hypothetical protein Hrvl_098 [Hildenbrandia rivularis]
MHHTYTQYYRKSFYLIIHLNQSSEVWLFNCNEGTQHSLLKHQIKLSSISKIFITDLALNSISGLPGLLSTLSLDNRNKTLYIYGPNKLCNYLKFNNKYSQTNFSYPVRILNLEQNYTLFHRLYTIHVISLNQTKQALGYIITSRQILGKFDLSNATMFNLNRGPLYGKLKQHNNFITPDGNEIQGKQFSNTYRKGQKIIVTSNIKQTTLLKELCWTSNNMITT